MARWWSKQTRWAVIPDHEDFSGAGRAPGASLGGRLTIWVAWEKQRRTTELARSLGLPLFRFYCRAPGLVRHLALALATHRLLRAKRPEILIVQNPSLILVLVSIFLKRWCGCTLIVDRHTNFALNQAPSLTKTVFTLISDFTLRHSDLTIVTNQPLADLVEAKGGHSFVLPDRIPGIPQSREYPLAGARNVCFICTFAGDEPYEEVVGAADHLPADVFLYITGNAGKAVWSDRARQTIDKCVNLKFTGFLAEQDYQDLLHAVDVIVDLTTFDHCLVCGAYEGAAVVKPLVLSQKEVNIDLFGDYPVYVEPNRDSILAGINQALAEAPVRIDRAAAFKQEFTRRWDQQFQLLQTMIVDLARG